MGSTNDTLWRFLVTGLGGVGVTTLDHLASERTVTPKLNEALELSFTVPSDNPQVNILRGDGLPFVAEGVRQVFGFRRAAAGNWEIKASTLVLQTDDAAHSDDARTRVTAWDSWQYLFSRPCLMPTGALIGADGYPYSTAATADVIAMDIIQNSVAWADMTAPVAAQNCFLDLSSGTIETCGTFSDPWTIQQGTSVGKALQDLCATGYMDIVMEPIYDPVGRPGILCVLNIFSQLDGALGAGSYNYAASFAWDRPGRNSVGMDNLYDGTGRANTVQYYNGQGGPPVARQTNGASIALYGEYWAQQFFPAQIEAAGVVAIAQEQLALRQNYRETLTVNPAPSRAPTPFVDYNIGDAVQVFMSNKMRQGLDGWQRVYGIPVEIDDNGVETVRELIVGPVGAPPGPAPVGGRGSPAPQLGAQVAITTSRGANRGGGIGQ